MSRTTRRIPAPVDDVFAVLSDPRTYPSWLVGAQSIRGVDADWPAVGSRFHHRVGFGPLTIADSSTIERIEAPRRLVLDVRAFPLGRGKADFTLHPEGDATLVVLQEDPVWSVLEVVTRPLIDLQLHVRNLISLRRLERVVCRQRSAPPPQR